MILAIIRGVRTKKCKREVDRISKRYNDVAKTISTPAFHGGVLASCVLDNRCCPRFRLDNMCQEKYCEFYEANHAFVITGQELVQAGQKAKEAQEKYENTIRGLCEKNISLYIRGK